MLSDANVVQAIIALVSAILGWFARGKVQK